MLQRILSALIIICAVGALVADQLIASKMVTLTILSIMFISAVIKLVIPSQYELMEKELKNLKRMR